MARTVVPVTVTTRAGVTLPAPVVGDPVNNHVITNDGQVIVTVQNTDAAAAHNVTFHVARMVDGFAVTSRTASIAASTSVAFGPFDPNDYGASLLVDVDNALLKLSAIEV